jgi:hypothetical protein
MAIVETFDTLKPRPGSGKRILKSKLLKALGATGANRPFQGNTERIIERKINLQNTSVAGISGGGSGLTCADGQAVVSAWAVFVSALAGTPPTAAVQSAMVSLYCGLESDGLLNQILSLYPFPPADIGSVAPNGVAQWIMAQTPLIHVIGANHGNGNPQANTQFSVNGVAGAPNTVLDPGINEQNNIPSVNNIGWFAYCAVATASGFTFGAYNTGGNGFMGACSHSDGNAYSYIGVIATNVISLATKGAGFYSGQRVSSTDHRFYFANATTPHAQIGIDVAANAAASFPNLALVVGATDNNASGNQLFSTDFLSCWGLTTGMTQADNKKLFTRLDTFRRTVGGGFA